MRERLEQLLGPLARAAWILTFHAACGRILRREAERLGYRSNFTIYDTGDQLRVVKDCLEDLDIDDDDVSPDNDVDLGGDDDLGVRTDDGEPDDT